MIDFRDKRLPPFPRPIKIALIYAALSSLWIYLSDSLLFFLIKDAQLLTSLQTYKGWVFISFTTLLIYLLLNRYAKQIEFSQEKLAKSEENFKAIASQTPDHILMQDKELRYVFVVNPQLGLTAAEMIGKTDYVILPREEAEKLTTIKRKVLETGKSIHLETSLISKTGEIEYFDGTYVPKFNAQGQVDGLIGYFRNVTQQKKAEAALRASEEKFAKVFRLSPDVIVLTSFSDGRIIEVNDRLQEATGYTREEIIGKKTLELQFWANPEDRKKYIELLHQYGRVRDLEAKFRIKSGEVRNTLLSGEIIELSDGKYILGVIRDITEQKQMEEALRESEERFLKAFQYSPALITICELESGRILQANESFRRTTGYKSEEVIGRTFLDLNLLDLNLWVNQGDRELYLAQIKEHGRVVNFEAPFRMKSGEIRIGLISGGIIEVKGKKYIINSTIDITERKEAEEELHRLNRELEERILERTKYLELKSEELQEANLRLQELDRLKSMFIASMSHELRTTLNSIIGFSSILLDEWVGPLNEEQKENLSIVLRAGKHLLALINDVIDVSKIEAGIVEPEITKFGLSEVLKEAINTVSKLAEEKKLEVQFIPLEQEMQTDRRRLLQCILNLLSNAVKFSEKGYVRLSANQESSAVIISVEDTGIGIREKDLAFLFQPFARLDSPLKSKVLGTGLGLYLTKKIVQEILHGEVMVQSKYGEGSTFKIKIPVKIQTTKAEEGGQGSDEESISN